MTSTDKATKAYAAIAARLSQFENDTDEFDFNNGNDFDMSMDDDDDDNDIGFSMIGGERGRGRTSGSNVGTIDTGRQEEEMSSNGMDDNDESFYSLTSNNQRFSMSSAKSGNSRRSSVVRSSLGFNSNNTAFATNDGAAQNSFGNVFQQSTQKQSQTENYFTAADPTPSNKTFMMTRTEKTDDSLSATPPTPFDNPNDNEVNSIYLESLDGDYRPYHEALQSFIASETNLYDNISTSSEGQNSSKQKAIQSKLKSIQLQYMNRLMRSNYDRSTLIQQNDDEMEYISTTRHLEKEGHLWSLLIHLLDTSAGNFVFWNQNLASSNGKSQLLPKMIHSFITAVVNENVEIDPAQMLQLIEAYFQYDDDDDDVEGGAKYPKHVSLPLIVKRRQVILAWIESCHNRSISALDVLNLHGERKDKIMWKDTLTQLESKQKSSSNIFGGGGGASYQSAKDKIDTFHPDAPIQLQMKSRSRASNPLYGSDGATETYLLSTFLSLLKAGRLADALEICREYGQAWRVAAWDGNSPHGYEEIVSYDENSDMEIDNDGETKMIRVGNPQRAFWKRSLWYASQSMHSLLVRNNTEKQMLASGSLVYEAAITSILADDTSTALKNPIFKRHWMDMVWVYYKGKQARFMEEIYCKHNDAKRSSFQRNNNGEEGSTLPEGTEFEQEEKEQLASTEEIGLMSDEVFLRNLEQKYVDKDVEDEDLSWRPGVCAFLSGIKDVKSYLISNIETLLAGANDNQNNAGGDGDANQYDQEALLRFIFHLVFLLDSLSSEDESLASFREEVIVPYRNDLLYLYIKRLMKHKPLWKFTCLYTSLLPMEEMINSLTDFWMKSIHDDKSRRVILNQARGNLSEGLDLVILRKVVRQSIYTNSFSETGSIEMFPTSIMRKLRSADRRLHQDDLIKIHSVHWLCIHDEHYADALVCTNMLLRQLFLHADEDAKEDEIGDWSNDVKLRTAKIFVSKLLPHDLMQKAINGGGICDSNDNNINEIDANNMCLEEFESYQQEFQSFGSFLEAHNAYEAWKDVIVTLPATTEFRSEGKFEEGSLESEIAIKMDKRNYIQNKRKNGLALIKIAEASYQRMMEVLEGGFLYTRPTEAGVVFTLDETRQRSEEMHAIQMKCLPVAVFLTYRILTETAHWMNEFFEDILHIFKGEALDILARIHMIQDDDESTSPYLPESWHAKASMLANLINEDETLAACFSQEDIEYFQSLMDETATYMKQCEERQI